MAAETNNYKTKNQIFADFISLANSALTVFDISGWKVKRLYQAVKSVDLEPFVFVQVINKHQLGSQYRANKKITDISYDINFLGFDGSDFQPFNTQPFYNGQEIEIKNHTYLKVYQAKQEIQIRFSATMRNKNTETTETLDSIDILTLIKNYIQSNDGIDILNEKGYAQYKATDINQQNFDNDDENVQFLPFFDCTFLYTDEWQTDINRIDKAIFKGIYKV